MECGVQRDVTGRHDVMTETYHHHTAKMQVTGRHLQRGQESLARAGGECGNGLFFSSLNRIQLDPAADSCLLPGAKYGHTVGS